MRFVAAVSYERGAPLVLDEVEMRDELRPHEVLVRNVGSGICHTDVTIRDLDPAVPVFPPPAILGHEGSGIVERVGDAVTSVSVGDPVVMSYHYDGTCPACRQGRYPYCADFDTFNAVGRAADGSQPITTPRGPASMLMHQSSFATYSLATDKSVHRVPAELPLELAGPLGCGFLTGAGGILNALRPEPSTSLAVFGVGAVGIAAMVAARRAGCDPVIAVDLHESRLRVAEQLGATHVVDASEEDAVAAIASIVPGGADAAFEASGVPGVMTQAAASLGIGGTALLCGGAGGSTEKVELSPNDLLRDRTVRGALMGHARPDETIDRVVRDGPGAGVATRAADGRLRPRRRQRSDGRGGARRRDQADPAHAGPADVRRGTGPDHHEEGDRS